MLFSSSLFLISLHNPVQNRPVVRFVSSTRSALVIVKNFNATLSSLFAEFRHECLIFGIGQADKVGVFYFFGLGFLFARIILYFTFLYFTFLYFTLWVFICRNICSSEFLYVETRARWGFYTSVFIYIRNSINKVLTPNNLVFPQFSIYCL